MRPFRFGVQAYGAKSMKAWRALAQEIEDLGYSSLLMTDHLEAQFGPIVAMAVAAEATTRLRVGTLVIDNDLRHPVVLAREIATLDLASEGRVEFGIGAGWKRYDYECSGIPFSVPSLRVSRMEESIAILKSLWAHGQATFHGQHYQIAGAVCDPLPVSRPHPDILIGGGSKRVLTVAGREADIVGINLNMRAGTFVGREAEAIAASASYEQRLAWVRAAAGARWEAIDLQVVGVVTSVGAKTRTFSDQMSARFGVSATELLDLPLAIVGTPDEICSTLIERRERWGFNYIVVPMSEFRSFAPVVERLAAT